MFTEATVIDTINVRDTNHIEIREAHQVLKDGVIISQVYHRHVLSPGDDLSTQDERVKAIAMIVHTPDVVAAYMAKMAAQSV